MSEALNLRRTLRALQRRWTILAAALVVGVALGSFLGLREPTVFVARSGVLLPPAALDASGKPLRNVSTEVQIAGSSAVLSRAVERLEPRPTVRSLRRNVRVRALSPDILQITAESESSRRAARIADTVASAYVDYSGGAAMEEADVHVAELRDQAAELDRRIIQLEGDMASARARLSEMDQQSQEALRQAALLDSVRLSQVETARELSSLNARIAEVQLNAKLARRGVRVLETAIPPSTPTRTRLITSLGLGIVASLFVGVVLAIAREQGDRRLRTRDEIAQAVGAPILLSFAVPARVRDKDCRTVYTSWEPSSVQQYAISGALRALGIPSNALATGLVVVTLPGDSASALFALHLAVFVADNGTRTALVIHGDDATTSMIRAACRTEAHRSPRPNLEVYGNDELREHAAVVAPATITLSTEPSSVFVAVTPKRSTASILAVSSGYATSETLASAALSCLDAGYPLRGVAVVNPDLSDRTTGRLVSPLPMNTEGSPSPPRGPSPARTEPERNEVPAAWAPPVAVDGNDSHAGLPNRSQTETTIVGPAQLEHDSGSPPARTCKPPPEPGSPLRADDGAATDAFGAPDTPKMRNPIERAFTTPEAGEHE